MRLVRIIVLSGIGIVCAWLAFGLWHAWEQAAQNSAGPGAVVLPVLAGALAITSAGAFLRLMLMLRRHVRPR